MPVKENKSFEEFQQVLNEFVENQMYFLDCEIREEIKNSENYFRNSPTIEV